MSLISGVTSFYQDSKNCSEFGNFLGEVRFYCNSINSKSVSGALFFDDSCNNCISINSTFLQRSKNFCTVSGNAFFINDSINYGSVQGTGFFLGAASNVGFVQNVVRNQIANFPASIIPSLNTSEVSNISTSQIQALSTNQLQALTINQFSALSSQQISSLSDQQIPGLTTGQISSLTTGQVSLSLVCNFGFFDLNQSLSISNSVVQKALQLRVPDYVIEAPVNPNESYSTLIIQNISLHYFLNIMLNDNQYYVLDGSEGF